MNDTLAKMFDGSLQSINIESTLDCVPYKDRINTLNDVWRKVRYGGTIELTGTDLDDLTRHIHQRYISTEEANQFLYSQDIQTCSPMSETRAMIQSCGFTIINARCNKYQYYIKAKRNEPNG